jgi:hypothetical protein
LFKHVSDESHHAGANGLHMVLEEETCLPVSPKMKELKKE